MKLKLTALLLSSSLLFGQEEGQPDEVPQLDPLVIESSPLSPSVSETTKLGAFSPATNSKKPKERPSPKPYPNARSQPNGLWPGGKPSDHSGMDKFRVRMSAKRNRHLWRIRSIRGPCRTGRSFDGRPYRSVARCFRSLYGGSAIGGVVNVIDRSILPVPYGKPGASLLSSYKQRKRRLELWRDGVWQFRQIQFSGEWIQA